MRTLIEIPLSVAANLEWLTRLGTLGNSAEEVLDEVVNRAMSDVCRVDKLMLINKVVTSYYQLSEKSLMTKARPSHIAWPRQICMWIARKETTLSLNGIGEFWGKDHGTVIHAVDSVESRIETDANGHEAQAAQTLRALCGKKIRELMLNDEQQ